jgi:hypothetical protein
MITSSPKPSSNNLTHHSSPFTLHDSHHVTTSPHHQYRSAGADSGWGVLIMLRIYRSAGANRNNSSPFPLHLSPISPLPLEGILNSALMNSDLTSKIVDRYSSIQLHPGVGSFVPNFSPLPNQRFFNFEMTLTGSTFNY